MRSNAVLGIGVVFAVALVGSSCHSYSRNALKASPASEPTQAAAQNTTAGQSAANTTRGGSGTTASQNLGTAGQKSATSSSKPGGMTAGGGSPSKAGQGGMSGSIAMASAAGAAGTLTSSAGQAGAMTMPADVAAIGGAENSLTDCTVAALTEASALPTIEKLPDPFNKLDGTRITTKAEWHCRQAEIRKQAENYIYGSKPGKPEAVMGTITNASISVNVMNQGKKTTFSAKMVLPSSGTAPYPAIIVYGGLGLGFGIPMDAGVINSEGIALIQYDVGVTGKEGTQRSNKQGAFYDIVGNDSATGLLMAWGWGVSRMIDVIEQSDGKLLRADAVGVTGCSRFGKGAFVAGAFDQRVALTMPIESGTAGVPIWRGIAAEGAQSLQSAYTEQPWFGDAFQPFIASPTKSPIDTHEVIGLIAPRGLFIMDNPAIANLGPKAAHVAALAGAEIYKALGTADSLTYYSAVQNGSHCSMRPEWSAPLQRNIRKFLTRAGDEPGVIMAAGSAQGDVASWVDWSAPTLN